MNNGGAMGMNKHALAMRRRSPEAPARRRS
uniref:Uncharacterized protein n=1 Tax=Arundo donax TaxID=35708 RepID=A0A0A9G3J1_ARUDO